MHPPILITQSQTFAETVFAFNALMNTATYYTSCAFIFTYPIYFTNKSPTNNSSQIRQIPQSQGLQDQLFNVEKSPYPWRQETIPSVAHLSDPPTGSVCVSMCVFGHLSAYTAPVQKLLYNKWGIAGRMEERSGERD